MSYFRGQQRLFASLLVSFTLTVFLITGCGFRPVYDQPGGQFIQEDLAFVSVAPIANRNGQLLRNRLLEKLTPRGVSESPRYRLSVELTSATESLLIQLDNTATRNNLKMSATFTLTDLSTDVIIYQGRAYSVTSYNVVESEFATVSAEKNAAERAARESGEEIFDLLVIYFNGRKS